MLARAVVMGVLCAGVVPAAAQPAPAPRAPVADKVPAPIVWQTQVLARLDVQLEPLLASLRPADARALQDAMHEANLQVGAVAGGRLADREKTAKIRAIHRTVVPKVRKALTREQLGVVRLGDKLTRVELLATLRGRSKAASYIGETEKNLARTDRIGGDDALGVLFLDENAAIQNLR